MNWIKPEWPAPKNVHAAVTLRLGGSSRGKFNSFNLADHVNDDPVAVQNNRKKLVQMLALPNNPIWMEQVHSNRIVKVDKLTRIEQADASYTDLAGIVCAVLTADCLPILLAATNGTTIAAVHAGWKGLLTGVISNAVQSIGTTEIIVWLGPAIGCECFEVGSELRNAFVNKATEFDIAFRPTNQDKYLADIYQLASIELSMLGISKIYGGNYCTMSNTEKFYSYRRDGETGRMATLIWRD